MNLFEKVCMQRWVHNLFFVLLAYCRNMRLKEIFEKVPFVTGVCEDEGTYVNWNKLYTLIFILSDSMFSFANISYVSLLYPLLVLTNLDSNNEEFLEYIKSRYVTWFLFTTQSRRLNPRQILRWITYNRTTDWNWPGISWRHNKGDCFFSVSCYFW